MAMTVMNNSATMMALGELKKNDSALAKSLKKVASGMKICSAGDDSANFAISEKMRVKIRGLEQDARNLQNGMSLAKVGLGGMQQIKDSLETMRKLALESANDTMTDVDRQTSQKVLDQLIQNVDDIATETTFNGIPVLMPTGDSVIDRSEEVDFVFIVDITGSMANEIEGVAGKIPEFANYLVSRNVDGHYSLVTYGDATYEPSTLHNGRIEQTNYGGNASGLQRDLQDLVTLIRGPEARKGEDGPESGLEAIMDEDNGALSVPFRENAIKRFIVLTDADVHDSSDVPDPRYTVTGTVSPSEWYSVGDVIEALKAQGVTVDVIGNTSYPEWSQITGETGGMYLDINDEYGTSLRSIADTFEYVKKSHLVIQDGTKANESIRMDVFDHRAKALKLLEKDPATGDYHNIKINPREAAVESLPKFDRALERVLDFATTYGSYISRMEHTLSTTTIATENTQASESTIRDADMAKEMVNYTKANVLSQSAQSMLAQANQNASSVLSLLQ